MCEARSVEIKVKVDVKRLYCVDLEIMTRTMIKQTITTNIDRQTQTGRSKLYIVSFIQKII